MHSVLSVSSLAWDAQEEQAGFQLLQSLGVHGTELIPARVEAGGVEQYRQLMARHDLSPLAMQSIFFGCEGMHLLRGKEAFGRLADRVKKLAVLGDALAVPLGIFGAPKLRNFGSADPQNAIALGKERLRVLDQMLQDHDFKLALEPVPRVYGNDFLTTSAEILDCISELGATNLALVQDTACIDLGSSGLVPDIRNYSASAAHFHVAEPHLAAFSNPVIAHSDAAKALREAGYRGAISIEMCRQSANWMQDVSNAVHFVRSIYGA